MAKIFFLNQIYQEKLSSIFQQMKLIFHFQLIHDNYFYNYRRCFIVQKLLQPLMKNQ